MPTGPFALLSDGDHVLCAVTGREIPLDELRYWSIARQEAYADAAASLEGERRAGRVPAHLIRRPLTPT